jgi:hypothetical protein
MIPFAQVGDFIYHCHIGEHQDGGMMAHIRVIANRLAGALSPAQTARRALSMKGIKSPSARVSGRQRVATVARLGSLGLRECQIAFSPRKRTA